MAFEIFRKNPSDEWLEKIKRSPNYKNSGFRNISETVMFAADSSFMKMMRRFFLDSGNRTPARPLPFVKTDLKNIQSDQPVIVWFGHSSYFIRINKKNILVDPVFSGNASPFSFMVKAFEGADEYRVKDLPVIDLLILTHDHYDHLDYKTILELKPDVKKIYCSLGVGAHLEYWGMNTSLITEFDWWEKHIFDDEIEVIATPARHFSGRTLKRYQSLWSSFILKTKIHSLFLGGDSGYDSHFKEIGEKFGPFDMAILESGQYNASWPFIHMMPEETVQATIDLNSKMLLPVHWGKFKLSMHDWNEPIIRVVKKAAELKVRVTTPMIGEQVVLGSIFPHQHWWNF